MTGKVKRLFHRVGEVYRQKGVLTVCWYLAYQVGRVLLGLDVTRVVWLTVESVANVGQAEAGITCRFLTPQEVRHYVGQSSSNLDVVFTERAEQGLDLCYAALDGDRLAAYGWYALKSIEARHFFGVAMSFPDDVSYMYNGFTHEDYRGKRLHGILMGGALKELSKQGVTKLVSGIDAWNLASLKSSYRLGYIDIGTLVTIGYNNRWLLYSPRAATRLGVKFGRHADLSARRTA